MKKAYLYLEDGEIIEGESFGFDADSEGEIVFTTGMTGYPETLTDPSFAGQIITFTYPLLGNYGIPKPRYLAPHLMENFESERIWAHGVVVSSHIETPSHYKMDVLFSSWLTSQKIPAIAHIDTRALTQKIREKGVMKAAIYHSKRKQLEVGSSYHLVQRVSLPGSIQYKSKARSGMRILLIDCGVKHAIIRELLHTGYDIIRIGWNEDPSPYLSTIDGVFCSNGPGDPKDCPVTIENIRKILKKHIPFIGVCLGHQLASLALGADTYKLPYGHRGLNQPCQDVVTKKAYITSQNHGYAVDRKTIPKGLSEWFINLNDETNEGLYSQKEKIWTTQFHPEGSPGPFDTKWIFSLFKK
jgi:carbamoyl-phosphate synthase small subunit